MASRPTWQPQQAASALEGHDGFAGLMQRLRRSERCYAAIAEQLPEGLRATVRNGPLSEECWSLLADSAAAAAKLRQMLPALQATLRVAGLYEGVLRVKVARREAVASPSGRTHRSA